MDCEQSRFSKAEIVPLECTHVLKGDIMEPVDGEMDYNSSIFLFFKVKVLLGISSSSGIFHILAICPDIASSISLSHQKLFEKLSRG